jgi:hypothetical protein
MANAWEASSLEMHDGQLIRLHFINSFTGIELPQKYYSSADHPSGRLGLIISCTHFPRELELSQVCKQVSSHR